MNPPAKLSDLISSLEKQSEEWRLYFDRQSGGIVCVEDSVLRAAEAGDDEQLAALSAGDADAVLARAIVNDDGARFIDPPDKFEFHEYRHMERFIGTVPDESAAGELWRAIKGKGAFRYFRDTADRLGLLDRWYRYRDEAMKEFAIDWAEANHVAFEDDVAGPKA